MTSIANRLRAIADALAVVAAPAPEPAPAPVPAPEPPPVVTPTSADHFAVFDDGQFGAGWQYFNELGGLQWRVPGGTWVDANGLRQGGAPLSSAAPKTLDWFELDVMPFMSRWATLNDGMFLHGGKANAAMRNHSDPALRPHLVVKTADSEFICPCIGNAALSASSTHGTGQNPTQQFGSGMMRFDVSAVVGAPLSAVARLYCTRNYGGAIGTFVIDAPRTYDHGTVAIKGGIAAEVADFDALSSHTDVLFAFEQTPDAWAAHGLHPKQQFDIVGGVNSGVGGGFEHIAAPNGLTWVRFRFPTDDSNAGLGSGNGFTATLDFVPVPRSFDEMPKGPTTTQPMGPTELWFQYGVMVEGDFAGIDDLWHNAGKLPGLTGRYGRPAYNMHTKSHYWDSWVEGQTPGLGRWLDNVGGQALDWWAGWAARIGWSSRAYGAMTNAMRKCVKLATYFYWPLKQTAGSGDEQSFDRAQLHPDRRHTIEQHIRMNTIDMSAPDAGGNGVGNPDGEIEVWLDGRLVYSRQDVIWRHHPGIAIQDAWLTFYNGGTQAGNKVHHAQFGPVIVATRYIGPRFSSEY